MQRLAIVSHKGGAGKSAVTAGVAAQLAARGERVMVIDLDPQGGVTAALGGSAPEGQEHAGNALVGAAIEHLVQEVAGLRLIPADMRLAGVELVLAREPQWQESLRRALDRYGAEGGDLPTFVVIDTPPGLGMLPFIGLRAAERALIVCPPDFASVRVVPHIIDTCARARADVVGLVPTMWHQRTNHARDAGAELLRSFESYLLPSIPDRVAVKDAALAGEPIQTFAPRSDAAKAFATLTERITSAS